MGAYAATTDVTAEKSQAELKRTVMRYGATKYATMEEDERAMVAFDASGRRVRFTLPLPSRSDREFTHHSRGLRTASAAEAAYEQAVRQKWRALNLVVKAKLEAIESGISTFDQEFYGHLVLPNGQTVFEQSIKQVDAMIAAGTSGPFMLES